MLCLDAKLNIECKLVSEGRDPDDNRILATAVAGEVEAVVTGDGGLLALRASVRAAGRRSLSQSPLMTPVVTRFA
jgi:predicted nucleic acid-binding protein